MLMLCLSRHIFVNAHNSLLTSHLNILPDWDMFQTSHSHSAFHAAGRCISGGPIYFTDEPGEHNLELIAAMTARTTRGKTIILRPPVIGKTVEMYTGYEEERLLKLGTYASHGRGGTSILGLFNISQRPLSELVNINSFPGIESEQEYILRAHTTGEVSSSIRLDSETPVVSLEIEVRGYEILSAFPLRSAPSHTSKHLESPDKVAVLGLLGKMTGPAAVLSDKVNIAENGRLHISAILKALGTLGIYISNLHCRSLEKDLLVMISGKVIPIRTVTIASEAPVLEIDVEKAWEELGLEPGYSNEIPVEVFVN